MNKIINKIISEMEKQSVNKLMLSELTGITYPTILKLINNQDGKIETLQKVCDVLKININKI